jgi:uncharacterized membrane protein (DUF2068 family)
MPARDYTLGLRTVAAGEAIKGLLVLTTGMGLLRLLHRDIQKMGEDLVRHLHLNPSARYPHIFLDLTARVTDGWLWALALGALLYSSLRFTEAYGLWHRKRWAAWLGAISGAVYLPFELVEVVRKLTAPRAVSLAVNLAVVGYLLWVLRKRQRLPTEGHELGSGKREEPTASSR